MKKKNEINKKIRVGGMVSKGSVKRELVEQDDERLERINFEITDYENSVNVNYIGILPDLFKEEQGVVVEGIFKNQVFLASKVLAKHDENYMPPEIKKMQIKKDFDNDS